MNTALKAVLQFLINYLRRLQMSGLETVRLDSLIGLLQELRDWKN